MAETQDQGEKTEEATQTRREDFRKRGQVAQTKELASALFILIGLAGIFALGRFFMQEIFEVFNHSLGVNLVHYVRNGDVLPALKFAAGKMGILIAPVIGIGFIVGIGSSILQIGFLQIEDAMSMDLNRISPLEGLKRMFSLRNLVEGVKAILKLIFILVVAYFVLRSEVWKLPGLMYVTPEQMMSYMGTMTGKLLGGIGVAMVILAAADFFFQKWDLEKKMMMTKQEVKEEHKSREGDPLIKARIRKIQREMANKRMMEKVPKADVIITNPTHIAVALKYDANNAAPQLVAKGADLMAEKIKEIAKQFEIPIVENKPLARTIFKTMKLGQVIPRELFVAVAEVLSYVYKLKRKRVKR
jgi:flagellar biosynthesis protein FlhB